MMKQKFLLALGLGAALAGTVQAQFAPLTLTPESYNYDVIVEKTAVGLPAPATTATLDAGTNNTAFTYYEQGFNVDAADTGLPAPGTTIVSETFADHSYTLAASYTTNNTILIDAAVTNAIYTVTTPTVLTGVSLLAAAGGGATTINVIVNHTGLPPETNVVVVPDWFGAENPALTLRGRVNAGSRGFGNVNEDNPRLYSVDVPVTGAAPVSSIQLQFVSGGGHAGVFAISGANGGEFTNLVGTGFTYDMIVEAGAETARNGLEATTASMDQGTLNTAASWYEKGYNPAAPATGLPAPSALVTNRAAADHVYKMAADYKTNNAILIDAVATAATITPSAPTTASGLSFLASSGSGAVTVSFTLTHADSTTQAGSFVVPDWFNVSPYAYSSSGRVDVATAALSAVNTENPRLYSIDVAVANTASPVATIELTHVSGTGHAAILAISSSAGAIKPIFDLQPVSVNVLQGGNTQLDAFVSGTPPITYRYQVGTNGNFVDVGNTGGFSGATTTNLVLTGATTSAAADYRLIATSSAGSSTSSIVRINVITTRTDVTTPDDAITLVGGTTPAAEGVANAINDTTTKYLNFGTDGNTTAGFTGPVGLEVTLSAGPAIVNGLRLYTANDGVERDPIDYKLEGSNDGTTYTTVATGGLALPTARNAGGLELDPLNAANQEITFANSAGYSIYRLTFTNVRDNTAANSMQIGEVELLGTLGAGAPILTITRDGNQVTITSSQPGTLESTTSLTPPIAWNNEGAITGSITVPTTGMMRFFRVTQP
jgi:hypothetical protein